jgi:uncharacterized membrane protein/predicted DsbA family dithiol-disulfide isomerase
MANRIPTVALRVALLVAIVVSAILLVDYRTSSGSLCGEGSGCGLVKASSLAYIGPIPMPAIGVGVFAGIFGTALWATKPRQLIIVLAQTVLAAAAAVFLIVWQIFVVGAVCKWCMTADVAAIAAAGLAYLLYTRQAPLDESGSLRALWGAAAATAIIVPLVWSYRSEVKDVSLPKAVLRLHQPNKINVVVFTDFECPFCEKLHDALREEEKALGDRIHVTRVMYPMPFHTGAKPAAQAYLCTPEKDQEALADKLYAAPADQLRAGNIVQMAGELGIDREWLTTCMASPATEEKLKRDMSLYAGAGLEGGVPASFVQDHLVLGADIPGLHAALDRALGGSGGGSDIVWMFVLLGVVTAGVAAASLVSAARDEEPAEAATERAG